MTKCRPSRIDERGGVRCVMPGVGQSADSSSGMHKHVRGPAITFDEQQTNQLMERVADDSADGMSKALQHAEASAPGRTS